MSEETISPSCTRSTPTSTFGPANPSRRTSMLASTEHPGAGVTEPTVAQPPTWARSAARAPLGVTKPESGESRVETRITVVVTLRTSTLPLWSIACADTRHRTPLETASSWFDPTIHAARLRHTVTVNVHVS